MSPRTRRAPYRWIVLLAGVALVLGGSGGLSAPSPDRVPTAGSGQLDASTSAAGPAPRAIDLQAPDVPSRTGGEAALADATLRELITADVHDGTINGLRVAAGRVRVEVLHTLTDAQADALVEGIGGAVVGRVPNTLLEADVPVRRLVALEAADGVTTVRRPLDINVPLDPSPSRDGSPAPTAVGGSFVGEELAKTNVLSWHAAGHTGAGVRVGIIDFFNGSLWNAARSAGEVPAPAGTFCRVLSSSCDAFSSPADGGDHGVAVAEIVHEMAPGASLYLATAATASDLQAAVDYFASRGVTIISRSIGNVYDGAGNGTGPIANVVSSAVSKGMTWFNAAGNSGGRSGAHPGGYWRGTWKDADADDWLEFGSVGELLPINCNFFHGLRWSDWGSNRSDYDVYLFDEPTDTTPLDGSENDQTTGALPLEHFDACWGGDWDYLAVRQFDPGSGTGGDKLEILVNGLIDVVWSNPYSAAHPASDSKSAGAVSVGAVDPAQGTSIASYSSQGPTNDGRIKPDLSAASCVRSFTYRPDCFAGTSAATPVAAGAAAVLRDAGWAASASSVKSFLTTYLVADRGSSGPDSVYGAGELRLSVFADTPTSQFVRSIERIADLGITAGCAPGRYCPDGLVTRGQMATFLARALNLPSTTTDYFTDDEGSVHEPNINRLRAAGITAGCGGTQFCPDGLVTRGQMATFLGRALGLPSTAADYFTDDEGSVHEPNINRLRASGITQGCGATTYCPNGRVTRGQMAAFLSRGLD